MKWIWSGKLYKNKVSNVDDGQDSILAISYDIGKLSGVPEKILRARGGRFSYLIVLCIVLKLDTSILFHERTKINKNQTHAKKNFQWCDAAWIFCDIFLQHR